MANRLQQNLARQLSDSVERLQEQVAKVEFWASAVAGFAQPVPDYDPAASNVGRYLRPRRGTRRRRRVARIGTKTKPATPASA